MSDRFDTAMQMILAERPSKEDVFGAVAMLEAASAEGDARASERLALFEAFGMVRPQSWERSLDLLQLAAEQGSRSAKEQLLVLADNPADPDGSETVIGSWRQVRASIPLQQRLEPGSKVALSETPRIRIIKSFASPAECRWIMSAAREHIAPATVLDPGTGTQKVDPFRDNSSFVMQIPELDVVTEVIRNRISAATRLPVPLFEPPQVLHYSVGQSFKPHHDFLDPANSAYAAQLARFGQRIATFLLYLNEGYEGGGTSFPAIGLNHRASAGDALFFANVQRDGTPDRQTLHSGLPPTAGEKWVFSQWIRDRLPAT